MSVHDFTVKTIKGEEKSLKDYSGKAMLIVNTASKCGLTPQYEQLQKLHEKYADQGLAILGFPCNQFLRQEPGSEEDIQQFCSMNYGVTFDMFSKIDVNGKERHPLYEHLAGDSAKFPGKISWNFEKFLVNKDGEVVARFDPKTTPDAPEVVQAIEKEIA